MADRSSSDSYDQMSRLRQLIKKLGQEIPDTVAGFALLHKSAVTDGARDRKTKELIALATGVALMMGGGPSVM